MLIHLKLTNWHWQSNDINIVILTENTVSNLQKSSHLTIMIKEEFKYTISHNKPKAMEFNGRYQSNTKLFGQNCKT